MTKLNSCCYDIISNQVKIWVIEPPTLEGSFYTRLELTGSILWIPFNKAHFLQFLWYSFHYFRFIFYPIYTKTHEIRHGSHIWLQLSAASHTNRLQPKLIITIVRIRLWPAPDCEVKVGTKSKHKRIIATFPMLKYLQQCMRRK